MQGCDLKESLHQIFDPCNVRFEDGVYGVFFDVPDAYEIWVAPTAIRNNVDILAKIRRDPCPEGAHREWLRYGFVIIAEKRGSGERCIQIEIFPKKNV
jgi:hypothetical protein